MNRRKYSLEAFELTPLTTTDADFLAQCLNDPHWRRMYGFTSPIEPDLLLQHVLRPAERDLARLIVRYEGERVGVVHLYRHSPEARRCHIGVGGLPSRLGTGIAVPAAYVVLDHAFRTYGLNRLVGEARAYNRGSILFSQRCGFQIEGRLRRHARDTDGSFVDVVVLGLLAEEFEAARGEWMRRLEPLLG